MDGRLKAARPYARFMQAVMAPVVIQAEESEDERRERVASAWWQSLEPSDRYSLFLHARDYMEKRA